MPLTRSRAVRNKEIVGGRDEQAHRGDSDQDDSGRNHLDIVGGVHVGTVELDVDVGDQGIMFWSVKVESEDPMPLTHSMATRLETNMFNEEKNRRPGAVQKYRALPRCCAASFVS